MNTNYLIILTILLIFSAGCKSGSGDNLDNDSDSTDVQDIDSTIAVVDTATVVEDTIVDEVKYEDPEVQEAHKEIVKKYGVQWDFFTCVRKSDSVKVNKCMSQK